MDDQRAREPQADADGALDRSSSPRAADGRIPGRRGRATRRRLLDETLAILAEVPYRDVAVVDITRRAGCSPATFYQYFPDIETAVLALTDEMAERGGRLLRDLVTEPAWESPAAARALADGFLEFFETQQALLRVIDLATLEGDERFRALRTRLLNGVYLALQDLVHESRSRGLLDASVRPAAVAGVLTTMLAHVSSHQSGLAAWGVEAADLAATMASIVDWSVRGAGSSSSN